jgi:hypothetical protein
MKISTHDYYEYHESKMDLARGQIENYFHCEKCDKDRPNEDMSEEEDVCQSCKEDCEEDRDESDDPCFVDDSKQL